MSATPSLLLVRAELWRYALEKVGRREIERRGREGEREGESEGGREGGREGRERERTLCIRLRL